MGDVGAPRGAIEVARALIFAVAAGEPHEQLVDELTLAVLSDAPAEVRLALDVRSGDAYALPKALRVAELVLERARGAGREEPPARRH